jgi:hypothetical protein
MMILILLKIALHNFFKWSKFCSGFTQGWKDSGTKTYLFTACTNSYLRFWLKLFLKRNILSTWSWLNTFVRFEYENSAIDVLINLFMKKYSTSQSDLWFWNFHWPGEKIAGHRTTANFEHCYYYFLYTTNK